MVYISTRSVAQKASVYGQNQKRRITKPMMESMNVFCIVSWPDPEKVDEVKVEFCPIVRSRTNEEKSIQ